MKKYIFTTMLMLSLWATPSFSQSWEELLQQLCDNEDFESDHWNDILESLADLALHPININASTGEDLHQIPFLTDQEIEDIEEYLYRYGTVTSLGELAMIPSISYIKRKLLTFFIFAGPPEKISSKLKMKDLLHYGKHRVLLTGKIPLYERKGDKEGYLGYPYRHQLRYQYQYKERIKMGIVGAQDAGEPFFAGVNSKGYDNYSSYLQIKKVGAVENLIIGNYRLNIGAGLVVNNDMSLGKSALLSGMQNYHYTLRPHSSSSSAYCLQGIASTLRLSEQAGLDIFVSHQHKDATLDKKTQEIKTILTSGYHRTQTEIDKKGNITQQVAGARLSWHYKQVQIGLSGVYSQLSRTLLPDTTVLYRRYYAHGQHFFNASTDYQYLNGRLSFSGETAIEKNMNIATLNRMSILLSEQLDVMVLQRFYSKEYTSLLSRGFSEGGRIQNESGLYVGFEWHPSRQFMLNYYTDYAYFPWPRYQISAASHTWDQQLSINFQLRNWTFQIRYRLKQKEKDDKDKQLMTQFEHKGRISLSYHQPTWGSQTIVQVVRIKEKDSHRGFLISNHSHFQPTSHWKLNLQMTYFNTDDYDSRLYQYEQGPLYSSSFNMYSGKGICYSLMFRYEPSDRWMICGKIGILNYFDRGSIGSGYQQIDHSSATDIQIQLLLRL